VTSSVVIVESGGANLASLKFAFERLGAGTYVTSDGATIASAERVVLPGVGAAKDAMERIRAAGLIHVLRTLTQPVLGICLGMQLLYRESEEGPTRCLGVVPETIKRLQAAPACPVPHMGWNQLELTRQDPLLEGMSFNDHVYFLHSYAAPVTDFTLASTHHGSRLSAVVRNRNFWGTQFHPERSGKAGARVLQNFLKIKD
jgi:imidazole glycerol-phosphate synthase subunit HisH